MIDKRYTITSTEFMNNVPGIFGAKNIDSEFICLSKSAANLLGWMHPEDCLGKTDYDIPCKASEFAEGFILTDKKTIQANAQIITLDMQHYTNGWKLVLSEKNVIKNSGGEVTGVFSQLVDVSKTGLLKYHVDLTKLTDKFGGKKLQPSSYILSQTSKPFQLTGQQENCLFLLIRAKTSKEIAKILRISYRTVEAHIAAIKHTLNCQNKSELIEKSIDQGFLYHIPQDFLPEHFKLA